MKQTTVNTPSEPTAPYHPTKRTRQSWFLRRFNRLLIVGLLGCTLASMQILAQETSVQSEDLTKREAALAKQAEELALLETKLAKQAEQLSTADEKAGNLDLRQAVLEAQAALVSWQRAEEESILNIKLSEKGIVSPREVDSARETAETAELAYKETLLQLEEARLIILKEAAQISVVEARVYRTDNTRKSVDVTLANLSNVGKAKVAYRDATKKQLEKLLGVPEIQVSLRKSAIIAEPYVQTIKKLDLDEKETLTFVLLQNDIEELVVDMSYFGKTIQERVFLRKDSAFDLPTVSSMNFDQSGKLGETINYDLILERLAETEKTYQLHTLSLPPELKVQFKDTEQKATVSSVKFAQDLTKKQLAMEVIIPEELPLEKLDKPVEFFIVALDDASREKLQTLKHEKSGERITEADLTSAKIAHERIVFTPRGVGEIELLSSDLYREISIGDHVLVKFKVKNTGTVPLRDVRMQLEPPADWDVTAEPNVIRTLDISEEVNVDIQMFPSPDLGVGDYTIRIDAECSFEGQKVSIDEKTVRVHVESKANVIGGLILLLVLAATLVGIAIFLVRLARR